MKLKTSLLALVALSIICYVWIGYFLHRSEFLLLFGLYTVVYGTYFLILRKAINTYNFNFLIFSGIVLRLLFLFSIPNLSDDFYRFIWDGRLMAHGLDPFAAKPEYYFNQGLEHFSFLTHTLYDKMNSPRYFTIYPPVNQFVFWLAAKISPGSILGSVVVIRCFILLCELGSLWVIKKLLAEFNLPKRNLLVYALNPLVIIELSGNLHFEAAIIFFLVLAVFLLAKNKWIASSLGFTIAVASKIWPLMFLPALFRRLPVRKFVIYALGVLALSIFSFSFILDMETIRNMAASVNLYFQRFEFNASVYYLFRWAGFQISGYNMIHEIGIILSILSFTAIIIYTLKEKKPSVATFPEAMLWILFIYLMFSTTIHPWYVTPLIAFCCFSRFRFPVVWGFMIYLSYTAYCHKGYEENLWLVALEYVVVSGVLAWETRLIGPIMGKIKGK